jgi:bacterioferritin-associated ferredoxin
MYICICNAVTDHEMRSAVELGCDTFRKASDSLGVGTCCGKCKREATRVIKQHVAEIRDRREVRSGACNEMFASGAAA